jgi:NAD(P)-dependent dehydrogenase (short-subunit alcohol dehydrogenase family)
MPIWLVSHVDIQSRVCLVTGANAGIGRAASEQLARAGHTVLMGCRDRARGEEAAAALRAAVPDARVSTLEIDLSLKASIRAAAAEIDALDVLIHNAAYFDIRQRARQVTSEGVELAWATNYLGPALLTELLLPLLRASRAPRVVAVTSKGLMMHPRLSVDLDDPEFQRRPFSVPKAYYHSKLAHLAWMLDLAERVAPVKVHGVRVTNVKIDTGRYPGLAWWLRAAYAMKSSFSISPAEMARTYVWLAVGQEPGTRTGGYWDGIRVPALPSRWAAERSNRAKLAAATRAWLERG